MLSNTTKDEELKALELWESMFGNMAVAYAGSYVITCKEFLERIKRYGLEQRIFGAQYAKQEIMREEESDAVYNIDVFIANLKQQLTPEEQEKL